MNHLPTKILLAADGSEDAAQAREAAVDLAGKSSSELHVVHVWHDVPSPYAHAFIKRELRRQGQEILDEQVRKIEEAGVKVTEAHLTEGRISNEVISLGEELGVGLLVVGSRGHGRIGRILMGSHSEDIVHHAHLPVLVLRCVEDAWPPVRVVIGDDFSEEAKEAGELAASIARLFEADTLLVRAYPHILEESSDPEAEESVWQSEKELEGRASRLEGILGHKPRVEMAAGNPAEAILEAARVVGPTLVAVGSRGLGTVERMRLGSVSTKVVRAAPGSALVCCPRIERG
ncbi:MAG: universal stress protein [Actinomycetota bacterium]|nr:universal stress protein [Actinomycetota bacterium]